MDRISEEIRTDVDGLENGCGSYPCRWTLGRMWERPCTSTSKRRERARVVVVRPGVRRRGRSFHHAWDARCFESAHGCNEVDGTECVRWQRLHRRMHVSRSKHPGGTVSTTRWCRFDRARMKLSSSPSAFRNRIGDAALLVERSTTSNAPFTRLRATRRPRMPAKRFAAACSIRSTNHWCDRCTRRNDDVRRSVFVEDGRTSLVDVSRSRRGDWYVCCVEETQLYGANPPKIHVEILSSEIRTWMGLRRPNLPRIRVGFDASSERRPWIIHRPGRAGASRETAISHDVLPTPATTSIASIARDGPRTVSCPSPPDGPRAQLPRLGGFSDASIQPFQEGHWSSRFLLRRFAVQCPPSSVEFGRSTSNGGFIGAERNP